MGIGGLSGATPSEAVSWGKIDPAGLPDTVVVYADTTIVLPIITSYLMAKKRKRPLKRLYTKRDETVAVLRKDYNQKNKQMNS